MYLEDIVEKTKENNFIKIVTSLESVSKSLEIIQDFLTNKMESGFIHTKNILDYDLDDFKKLTEVFNKIFLKELEKNDPSMVGIYFAEQFKMLKEIKDFLEMTERRVFCKNEYSKCNYVDYTDYKYNINKYCEATYQLSTKQNLISYYMKISKKRNDVYYYLTEQEIDNQEKIIIFPSLTRHNNY